MRTFLTSLFIAFVAVVAVSCDGGTSDAVVDDAVDGPDAVVDVVEDVDEIDTVVVPSTLKPGSAPVLGEVASEIQVLEDECGDALAPIRALYDVYPSGLEMDADALESFNEALRDGFSACDTDDWNQFQQFELAGLMNAAPSS